MSDFSVGLNNVRKKLVEDIKVTAHQVNAGFTPNFAQNFEIGNRLSSGDIKGPQSQTSAASL